MPDQFSISRLSKRNITPFQISIALSPPLQGYNRLGRATQAKAWARFSWPFGPLSALSDFPTH